MGWTIKGERARERERREKKKKKSGQTTPKGREHYRSLSWSHEPADQCSAEDPDEWFLCFRLLPSPSQMPNHDYSAHFHPTLSSHSMPPFAAELRQSERTALHPQPT